MRVWALVSSRSRETVELFLDPLAAVAALDDVLRDEPTFASILRIVELNWNSVEATKAGGVSN